MNRISGWGFVLLGLGIAMGAFGAHGLRGAVSPAALETFKTGVHYHQVGSLALIGVGLAAAGGHEKRFALPAWGLGLGVLVFSLTLTGLALGGPRWLGAITPLGGALMIGACAWTAWLCLTQRRNTE